MAESSRIEDLRKRYHENPRRFFAPLANEYRKSGFLDRAILLCEKHLSEQPENMNGLVVYGQVLFESGKQQEARGPFESALKLDPENLIALRHLGDIARTGGDLELAKSWYLRVLEVDRGNDDVIASLEQLKAGERGAAPAASASSFVSVASNVSVSGGNSNLARINVGKPAEAPSPSLPPTPSENPTARPMKTPVVDAQAQAQAQALADADRRSAQKKANAPAPAAPAAPAAPVAAAAATVEVSAAVAPPRPPKRASLLDIAFDFGEIGMEPPTPSPTEPVLSGGAPEYGFVDVSSAGDSTPLGGWSSESEPPTLAGVGSGLELADNSSEASPLGGLESTEFLGGQNSPPLDGLASATDVEAPAAESAARPPAEPVAEPVAASVVADDSPIVSFDDLDVSPSEDQTPIPTFEPPSGPHSVPRMTKASMASIPLLADFGLEDDDPTDPVPAPEPRKSQPAPTFVTETMAALYIKQGFKSEAIEVYRQLITQDPSDAGLKERLAAMERDDQSVPEFEAPAPNAPEPTPAPANAALAEVSFAGVGLATPAPTRTPSLATAAPPVPAGPSAREFFSGFARRRVAVNAAAEEPEPEAAPVAATGWPLDTIFGASHEVNDLHAAEVLAGVATFAGPTGGSGLDELFASDGSAVAAPPAAAPAAAPTATHGVPRASELLKFDQFFSAPGTSASETPAPPSPLSPHETAAPAAAGDDDVDEFQGWLRGLKP